MKIRQLTIELRELEDKRMALSTIPEHIKTLEMSFSALRAASTDGEAVSGGGGSYREEAMINNIAMRDKMARDLEITRREVARLDAALEGLDDSDRLIIDRCFLHRSRDSIDRLCDELGYSRAQVYRLKDVALVRLANRLYGLPEV